MKIQERPYITYMQRFLDYDHLCSTWGFIFLLYIPCPLNVQLWIVNENGCWYGNSNSFLGLF